MKRICKCGVEYRYNIEEKMTEFITDNGTVIPVKFCHECGGDLSRIDLNELLSTYFNKEDFIEAAKQWDNNGLDVVCLYRGDTILFRNTGYRKDFKVNLSMILDGHWYVSKNKSDVEESTIIETIQAEPVEREIIVDRFHNRKPFPDAIKDDSCF